jgi:hypothetical protein
MDQQRSGNGKNNVHPSLSSMQQQMPPTFQGNIPLAQMGNNGEYQINNGAYYKTPAAAAGTMMSPPPGFGMQNLNMGTHPVYQQQMGMSSNQNYYPASGGFQQMPMFNNTFGSESNMMHPTLPMMGNQNYFSAANENFFNNNGTFDQEIDKNKGTRSPMMMMMNGGKTEFSPSSSTIDTSNSGITPMIDNIVGSMMGNGTYTHFGPSGGITPSSFATKFEPTMTTQATGNLSRHESMTERRRESPVLGNSVRASTPNDLVDNLSRPQTPNVRFRKASF